MPISIFAKEGKESTDHETYLRLHVYDTSIWDRGRKVRHILSMVLHRGRCRPVLYPSCVWGGGGADEKTLTAISPFLTMMPRSRKDMNSSTKTFVPIRLATLRASSISTPITAASGQKMYEQASCNSKHSHSMVLQDHYIEFP